jgi:Tol biopolymer transport system component
MPPTAEASAAAEAAPSPTVESTSAPERGYEILYFEDDQPMIVGADGDDPRRLALGLNDETMQFTISPDGQWLAYFLGADILVYNLASGGPPMPFVHTTYVRDLRWKPDSQTLFFAVYPRGGREMGGGVWSFSFTGIDPVSHVNSTEARADWRLFSFSPDGHLAALCPAPIEAGFTCGGLYVLDIVLRLAQPVDLPRGCDPVNIVWSPDGTRLAVSCNPLLGVGSKIFSVDPRSLTSTQLSPRGWNDSAPAWSLDGTRIAFRACIDACELWVMDANNGEQRAKVGTSIIGTGRLLWTPEGDLLAAVRDERGLEPGLYRISTSTGGAVLLTPGRLTRLMGLRLFEVTAGQ